MTISPEFEPVEPLPAREHILQGANAYGERQEADPVEAHPILRGVGRERCRHAGERREAHWHQDVKGETPAVGLSEPARHGWTDHWPDHASHGGGTHGEAQPFLGIDVQYHCLIKRQRRGTECPLQDAPENQFLERLRQPTHQESKYQTQRCTRTLCAYGRSG